MKDYKYEIYGVLFAGVVLNLWYLSGLAIENKVIPINYEHFIRAVTVAGSAAIGAFLAFKFNWNLEKKKRNKEEEIKDEIYVAKLNRAILHLFRLINSLDNIKETIDEFESEEKRAFEMSVTRNFETEVVINIDELALILTDELPLLLDLDNVQTNFRMTLACFDNRQDTYLNRLMPELEKKGLLGAPVDIDTLKNTLEASTFNDAIETSRDLVALVNRTHKDTHSICDKFIEACNRKYPNNKFLTIEQVT